METRYTLTVWNSLSSRWLLLTLINRKGHCGGLRFVGLAILKSQTKDNWRLWSTTPTHRKIGYSSVNAKQSLERSEFNTLSTMWRRANGTRQDARHCGMGSMTSCRGGGSRRNRELAPPTQSPGQNAPGTAAGAQCGWCPGL